MAICGNPESRRGIILAKNALAKSYGVKTAETIWQAKQKCPNLVLRPARHPLYREYCTRVNSIYKEYTDQVEHASIDESYLDVTGSLHLFGGDAHQLACKIQQRVTAETGLTVSVGISFNKVFAKMASELEKPNGISIIDKHNFQDILWPMPVTSMLFVGKSTAEQLRRLGIFTIAQLAQADTAILREQLGKQGMQLHLYANGLDTSPVLHAGEDSALHSIGNGMTFKRNLISRQDILTAVTALSDTVASRMRKQGVKCMTVQVAIKDENLKVITRQKPVETATWLAEVLCREAMALLDAAWKPGKPIRMLTITAQKLISAEQASEQLSLFHFSQAENQRDKRERLEKTLDQVRDKFGLGSISAGSLVRNDLGINDDFGSEED